MRWHVISFQMMLFHKLKITLKVIIHQLAITEDSMLGLGDIFNLKFL